MSSIEFRNVYKQFETFTLHNISFKINNGEYVLLIGPSGSGKTMILELITGNLIPDYGDIIIDNKVVSSNGKVIVKPWCRNIGYVPQNLALFPHLNVFKNIAYSLMIKGFEKSYIERKVIEIAEKLQIKHLLYKKPNQLSGGEQQRVAIARAIVTKPKILLADEPTGNLDAENTRKVMEIFTKLNKEYGITIVLATHNIELLKFCDRVTQLRSGELIKTYVKSEIPEIINILAKVLRE